MCCGCEEEIIRQIPVDHIAPQQVTNVQVENLPGKVKIKYTLPDETDLLYVKAVYENSQGQIKEVKASSFKNNLEIVGFGLSKKQMISLISVDRSQNESESVAVEIEPLDSPIYNVLNTLSVSDSWGGVKFTWENPEREELVVEVLNRDEEGVYKHLDAFYSSFSSESRAIRGLDTIPYQLAYFIRDSYGNYTDTLKTTQIPLFEMELPGKLFKICALPTGYELSVWGSGFESLFNYDYTGPSYYIAPGSKPEPYFTFDMQKTYLLSRFKVWPRCGGFEFGLHNPKDYEIWGSNDPDADRNPDSWDGWEKLVECHEYVPSGNPPSSATNEDKEYFRRGQEYEFTSTKGYRFLRFKVIGLSWGGSTGLQLMELRFWGKEAL